MKVVNFVFTVLMLRAGLTHVQPLAQKTLIVMMEMIVPRISVKMVNAQLKKNLAVV